jgi:hypothetical protein
MLHARKDYQDLDELDKNIPAKEPVFLVRAQDMAGAATVRAWATFNAQLNGSAELTKAALQHACKMDAWPKKKLADL